MAKRKREIKQTESARESAPQGETDLLPREAAPAPRAARPTPPPRREPASAGEGGSHARPMPFSAEMKENLLLGVLILYVLLLALGTAGELFEVDWILGLPLFK